MIVLFVGLYNPVRGCPRPRSRCLFAALIFAALYITSTRPANTVQNTNLNVRGGAPRTHGASIKPCETNLSSAPIDLSILTGLMWIN
jgi:hypothetical protein